MMIKGFGWDNGNWPKCAKHGVSKAEIEFVLSDDPLVLPDKASGGIEVRFNAVGRNDVGRYLFIVFMIREIAGDRFMRPISARYMHKKEIEAYERTIKI
ncbi:BrnT family toxin [Pararhizobium sp.]|uniref:BrnT family toxin n=1 Tax=Pararhizobium sp. TaxID=1977563 RepID=UPI002718E025|nr:BrnT family toxin [Pararhizobium sp.]MDO9415227.1 BrnT family toxin [Pararhizobium sp.]